MSHRWMPTMAQVEEAARKLPSVYHFNERDRGPMFRVAVVEPLSACRFSDISPVEAYVRTIDFRLEERKDPEGFGWRRWVYAGPVVV